MICGGKLSSHILRYYPGLCLVVLSEITVKPSLTIAGFRSEIRTRNLPNTMQEHR